MRHLENRMQTLEDELKDMKTSMPTPIRRTEVIQTEIQFREEEYSIVDDVDTFHSGAEQDLTFFAEQMEADFTQPLEFFKVA